MIYAHDSKAANDLTLTIGLQRSALYISCPFSPGYSPFAKGHNECALRRNVMSLFGIQLYMGSNFTPEGNKLKFLKTS
jgi:hypothetical protein